MFFYFNSVDFQLQSVPIFLLEAKKMRNENKVRVLRRQKKLRLVDLARMSGLSITTVWNLEQGVRPAPSTLAKIAKALGVDEAELISETR